MPTNRRFRLRPRRQDLQVLVPNSGLEEQLLTGSGWFEDLDADALRDAWELHRDEVRQKWAAENPPGTRCFAEHLFEIVPKFGERRIIDPRIEPHRNNWLTMGILHTRTWPPIQEAEHEFLYRHGIIGWAEYQAAIEHEAAHE